VNRSRELVVYAIAFLLLAGAMSLWWQGIKPRGGGDLVLVPKESGTKAGSEETAQPQGQNPDRKGGAASERPVPGKDEEPRDSSTAVHPDPAHPPETERTIYVHVAGAVESPGVFRLKEGQRVFEAVELARPVESADLDALNLALVLRDGDKIYVPRKGEKPTLSSSVGFSGDLDPGSRTVNTGTGGGAGDPRFPININTANLQELDALPGIGPSLAAAIINYRQEFGPFTSPEDIKKVPGIGEKTYLKLSNLITVR